MISRLSVRLSNDVYRACYHHALSTQSQEIVGLLIGQVQNEIIDIFALKIVKRLDKKQDRVEISDEQLMQSMTFTEELKTKLNKPGLNVVGWYHSHPNITVWPSHVDLKTQFSYQRMSQDWIGLIFAVFNKEKVQKSYKYELVAFQACHDQVGNLSRLTLPIEIVKENDLMPEDHVLEEITKLSDILLEETKESVYDVMEGDDYLTRLKRDLGTTLALLFFNPKIQFSLCSSNSIRTCANLGKSDHSYF